MKDVTGLAKDFKFNSLKYTKCFSLEDFWKLCLKLQSFEIWGPLEIYVKTMQAPGQNAHHCTPPQLSPLGSLSKPHVWNDAQNWENGMIIFFKSYPRAEALKTLLPGSFESASLQ